MMNKTFSNSNRVFNTPLDIGLRILFFLKEGRSEKIFDLQSLVYFDYFMIHSGDIGNGPESLHPAGVFRAGEILIKRELMREGLRMMHSKNLLDVLPKEQGIYYTKNELTNAFIKNYTQTEYTRALQERARWVHKKFGRFDELKLKEYVSTNLTKWGLEFVDEKGVPTYE